MSSHQHEKKYEHKSEFLSQLDIMASRVRSFKGYFMEKQPRYIFNRCPEVLKQETKPVSPPPNHLNTLKQFSVHFQSAILLANKEAPVESANELSRAALTRSK
jgi:hypothetical protein